MNPSKPWTFNTKDWEKWSFNFVRFVVVPTSIAFLVSVQGGLDFEVAKGVAVGTLYTSLIDWLRKFAAGEKLIEPTQLQNNLESEI